MFCLENSYTSFQSKLYKNNQWITTGGNFSVSLANIALHYITKRIKKVKTFYIYKRYIDDILYNIYPNSVILEGELSSAEIQAAVGNNYGKLQSAFNNFRNTLKKIANNKKCLLNQNAIYSNRHVFKSI